jgi:uncharacterized membrane protein YcaP (DUF421 family)
MWDLIEHMFRPSQSVIEIVIRGSIMYLSVFALMRVLLKRRQEGVSAPDVLLVVLISDAAQNGMAGEYRSITEGLALVVTILFWNVVLDWLSYRFRWFERLISPPPLLLIDRGKLLAKNMRQELVTRDEILSKLRELGIDDPSRVERAYLEWDGQLSVAPRPSLNR